MTKWICPVCGYVHEGPQAPEFCPQCKVPGSKFSKKEENTLTWAAEHVVGIAKDVPEDIYMGLKANFDLVGDLRSCKPRDVQNFLKKQTTKTKTDCEMIVLTEGITDEMMA